MGTLNHVGISHLFLVPNIRSSTYLSLLAEACPEIPNSPKGVIQAEALPHLKVGVDAKAYYHSWLTVYLSTLWLWTTSTTHEPSVQSWITADLPSTSVKSSSETKARGKNENERRYGHHWINMT